MKAKLIASAVMALAALSAQAASIVAPSATFTGTVIDFDNFEGLQTAGPLDLGHGITLTSTPVVEVGAYERALGTNGAWTTLGDGVNRGGNFVATEFVTGRGEFGFSFATPVSSVGAFVNQFQTANVPNSMLVIAYDQYNNVLESFRVSVDTDEFGYDEGKFVGFMREAADIYGFGIADGTFVVDNLTVSAVPEAGTVMLGLAGLGVLIGRKGMRRRPMR